MTGIRRRFSFLPVSDHRFSVQDGPFDIFQWHKTVGIVNFVYTTKEQTIAWKLYYNLLSRCTSRYELDVTCSFMFVVNVRVVVVQIAIFFIYFRVRKITKNFWQTSMSKTKGTHLKDNTVRIEIGLIVSRLKFNRPNGNPRIKRVLKYRTVKTQ